MKEDQHTEFKRLWKDEYIQYISGFANAQGGILFIGIGDDGTVCGVNNAAKLLADLPNQIKSTRLPVSWPKWTCTRRMGKNISRLA
ncbi:MAG: ATP-binding protein [Paludibacteraceae bacterium]|nr:ATP-binding protein [Paludibacteraceae bacterium]